MDWLIGSAGSLGIVAAKAALIYLTAVVGLRLGERRTLAQWTITDAAAAVALGTIIGRTSVADTQSYLTGACALVTLIVAHRLLNAARFHRSLRRMIGHRIRVLVIDGDLQRRQMRLCGLTDEDLYTELRLRGIFDLAAVRYVLFEPAGGITVVPADAGDDGALVHDAIDRAVALPGRREKPS